MPVSNEDVRCFLLTDKMFEDRAPWSLGKKVEFMWGKEILEACEHKWVFQFEARSRVKLEEDCA